jgi:hypothetical protein
VALSELLNTRRRVALVLLAEDHAKQNVRDGVKWLVHAPFDQLRCVTHEPPPGCTVLRCPCRICRERVDDVDVLGVAHGANASKSTCISPIHLRASLLARDAEDENGCRR